MMRRRGPGLVGTMARTAVVAGTASAVAGRVHHRQEEKWAAQEQAAYEQQGPAQPVGPAAAPAAPAQDDQMAQIQKLADLHAAGVLSDEEFAAAKAKILGI